MQFFVFSYILRQQLIKVKWSSGCQMPQETFEITRKCN